MCTPKVTVELLINKQSHPFLSSLSGVHYRDNAILRSKFHIKYRVYLNYVGHNMIIRCYMRYFNLTTSILGPFVHGGFFLSQFDFLIFHDRKLYVY